VICWHLFPLCYSPSSYLKDCQESHHFRFLLLGLYSSNENPKNINLQDYDEMVRLEITKADEYLLYLEKGLEICGKNWLHDKHNSAYHLSIYKTQ
jgi:hypothetical protein